MSEIKQMEMKRMGNRNWFSTVLDVLYSSSNIEEIWRNSIMMLANEENHDAKLVATRLVELNNQRGTKSDLILKFLSEIRNDLDFSKVKAEMYARQKAYISLIEKLNRYLRNGDPLSRMKDFLGCRVVISSDKGEKYNIEYAYELCIELINFMQSRFLQVEEAEPKYNVANALERGSLREKGIYIPKRSPLPKILLPYVKDYMANPKPNGYQALHIIFKLDNIFLEFQIWTQETVKRTAHGGCADHTIHKERKYTNRIDIDLDKIHVEGVKIEEGRVKDDKVGLFKPLPLVVF